MNIRDQLQIIHYPQNIILIVPSGDKSYSYLFEEIDIKTIEPEVKCSNHP